MKKIITSKLNTEIKSKLTTIIDDLECGLNERVLDKLLNITNTDIYIKYIEDDNSIIAFCIYSNIIKNQLLEDLEASCDHYDDEVYEYFEDIINKMHEDTIYIHYIESIHKGFNYGNNLLNSIIDLDKDIILYSTIEAETFWRKQNFDNIFGFEYIYYA